MPVERYAVTQQELAEALAFDDELLTGAERAAIQEAIDDPGPNIPHQEVLREFGL